MLSTLFGRVVATLEFQQPCDPRVIKHDIAKGTVVRGLLQQVDGGHWRTQTCIGGPESDAQTKGVQEVSNRYVLLRIDQVLALRLEPYFE